MEIEWTDPPPPRGGGLTKHEQRVFAEKLRARPGDWAVYPLQGGSREAARALASRISHGRQGAFGDDFEAISRDGIVYVRFTKE